MSEIALLYSQTKAHIEVELKNLDIELEIEIAKHCIDNHIHASKLFQNRFHSIIKNDVSLITKFFNFKKNATKTIDILTPIIQNN